MFASHEGPDFLEQGESYIEVQIDLISYMEASMNRSTEVGYAVYAANEGHEHDTLLGICSADAADAALQSNTWAANVFSNRVKSTYMDTVHVHDMRFGGGMGLPNGAWLRVCACACMPSLASRSH